MGPGFRDIPDLGAENSEMNDPDLQAALTASIENRDEDEIMRQVMEMSKNQK